MSDKGDSDNSAQQGERPQPPVPNSDLADAFHLFRDYLAHKLVDLKSDLVSEQDNLSRKLKEEVDIKFKKEGNKIQFRFNEEILNGLLKLQKNISPFESKTNSLISELISKVKARNKLIRIADTSVGGWATVRL